MRQTQATGPILELLPSTTINALAFDDAINSCWVFMFVPPKDGQAHVVLTWHMNRAVKPLWPPSGYCLWKAKTLYRATGSLPKLQKQFPAKVIQESDFILDRSLSQQINLPVRFMDLTPGILLLYRDAISKEDTALGDAVLTNVRIHWPPL